MITEERTRFEVLLESIETKVNVIAEGHGALVERYDALAEGQRTLVERLDRIETKVDVLESRSTRIETKVDALESRFTRIETKVDVLESRFTRIETKVDGCGSFGTERTGSNLDRLRRGSRLLEHVAGGGTKGQPTPFFDEERSANGRPLYWS